MIGGLTALTAQLDGLRPDQNPDDLSNALRAAFEERELYDLYISFLVETPTKAKALLGVFDKVSSVAYVILWIGSQHRRTKQALAAPMYDVKIFKKFRQLCGRTGLLPASHTLPEQLIRTSEFPVACGSSSDVWEGVYGDKRVAIKALRVYKNGDIRRVRKVSNHIKCFRSPVDSFG